MIKYKFTFVYNNATANKEEWIEYGTSAKEITPKLFGYKFEGWYTDNGEWQQKYDFSTPITGDVTIYAKWIEKPEPWWWGIMGIATIVTAVLLLIIILLIPWLFFASRKRKEAKKM